MSTVVGTQTSGADGSNRGNGEAEAAAFDWPLAYDAEKFLRLRLQAFLPANSFASNLSDRLRDETATDFFEWIDHLVLSSADEPALRESGYTVDEEAESPAGETVLHHPRATLPRIILQPGGRQAPSVIALRTESLADFVARNNLSHDIEGASLSSYRKVLVAEESGTRLEAVERNAYRGFVTTALKPGILESILKVKELWKTRRRHFTNDADGFVQADRLLNQSIPLVGRDLSCQFFFEEERAYWQSRNQAARIQKFRQDRLGLGWGNHDHHTFRCSRAHFVDLIEFLLKLGFVKRERYYAGAEAGWGAQILEQPIVGIVVFADVDLMPDETQIDFSVNRLPPAAQLGTVGLWCGLHGESFLDAGVHHLEARFDHALLREQLSAQGIKTMNPFSSFEFLQQAFTEGERWPVNAERAQRLLATGHISKAQFEKFTTEGALGSHLENLQRHGGFKGFNQKSVSVVIAATDPRKSHFTPASA